MFLILLGKGKEQTFIRTERRFLHAQCFVAAIRRKLFDGSSLIRVVKLDGNLWSEGVGL